MVRIPDRPYARIAGGRLDAPQGTSGEIYRALGRLGDGIFNAAMAIRNQREHDALVSAQASYASGMSQWRQSEEEGSRKRKPGEYIQLLKQQHDDLVHESLDGMREAGISDSGRQAFTNWAENRESVAFLQAARLEQEEMRALGREAHNKRLSGIFEDLKRHPQSLQDGMQQMEESYALAVGQGLYRPEEAKERFGESKERLRHTAFTELYRQDPAAAMLSMEAMGLSDTEKAVAEARYRADKAQELVSSEVVRADRLRALAVRKEDAVFHAEQHGEAAELRDLAAQFETLGESATAQELSRTVAVCEEHGAAIRESRVMPLPLLEKTVSELRGKLTDAPGKLPQGREKAGEELRLRSSVYEERLRALQADPAEAVSGEVEALITAKAFEAASSLGEGNMPGLGGIVEDFVNARLSAQEGNGLATHKRRALTNAEAAEYRDFWQGSDAEGRHELLLALKSFGRHALRAASEIGLTASERLLLMQSENDPVPPASAKMLLSASSPAGEGDVGNSAYAEKEAGALRLSEVARAFRASADRLPGSRHAVAAVENIETTLRRLVRMQGGDVAAAVAVLDGKFKALLEDGFALVYGPASFVDPNDLRDGLLEAQYGPYLEEFARQLPISGEERGSWLRQFRDNGFWINAPDGDGYVLFDRESGFPALDGQVSMLRQRDGELRKAAMARRLRGGGGR